MAQTYSPCVLLPLPPRAPGSGAAASPCVVAGTLPLPYHGRALSSPAMVALRCHPPPAARRAPRSFTPSSSSTGRYTIFTQWGSEELCPRGPSLPHISLSMLSRGRGQRGIQLSPWPPSPMLCCISVPLELHIRCCYRPFQALLPAALVIATLGGRQCCNEAMVMLLWCSYKIGATIILFFAPYLL